MEISFIPGGYYHLYNRGTRKQDIFKQEADYISYLGKVREYKEKYNVSVICYCLMPNHIHLLARQDKNGSISKFLQALHTSYSMRYNVKYNKEGHLFQGRFRRRQVDDDKYLLAVSSYIHLNPVMAGLINKLEDYPWSSYPDYIGLRNGTLCNKKPVIFNLDPKEYQKVTEEQIKNQLLKKEFLIKLVLDK